MTKAQREYKKALVVWVKEIADWQIANPDRDWLTELTTVTSDADDGGGSNPPTPPPPPPRV